MGFYGKLLDILCSFFIPWYSSVFKGYSHIREARPRFAQHLGGKARQRLPRLATIQSYKNGGVSCRDEYSLEFAVQ